MILPQTKIIDLLPKRGKDAGDDDKPTCSFEYFPPKTVEGEENLMKKVISMGKAWRPLFVDFTWGAGGTTSNKTLNLSINTAARTGIPVNMHLTCTNMPQSMIDEALETCHQNGIRNIVALRGDPPKGQTEWQSVQGGFTCALDLVRYIRQKYGDFFCISVAGYPEGHVSHTREVNAPSCGEEDLIKDILYLKEKVDAGADFIITQLFYSADCFVRFVKLCRSHGITCPILPGILPMVSYSGFIRMTEMCKTHVPDDVRRETEARKNTEADFRAYGVQQAVKMCESIRRELTDAKHFHIYTLNEESSTDAMLQSLGYEQHS